ncbi:MAG: NADH:ubiquinone reductase (Na(+)-transporting) subunit F, partial [Muribaculaceae bacterium]|nr:NADH:ubiquinone reductase (Na(+)-transporting) subunit F [Muribaculaceae bacterium]
MLLLDVEWNKVLVAALIFFVIVLVLVVVLLVAKRYLVASGDVTININDGKKVLKEQSGKSLLATLA